MKTTTVNVWRVMEEISRKIMREFSVSKVRQFLAGLCAETESFCLPCAETIAEIREHPRCIQTPGIQPGNQIRTDEPCL